MGTEQASRTRRLLHRGGWLFGLVALLALLAVVAHLGDIERFLALLRSLAPEWLLLALLLQSGTYACLASAWREGLRHAGANLPWRKLLPLAIAKLFIDQTVPTGGVSGIAFLVAALARRGVPRTTCLAAMLPALVGYYAAYLLAATAALGLLAIAHEARRWMLVVFALFAAVCLAIPAAVLLLRRRGTRHARLLRHLPAIMDLMDAASAAPATLLHRPRVLFAMTALSLAMIVLDAGTLWVMLHAIGLHVGFHLVFPSLLLAMMVTTLGPIPLGLGSFEATCVGALALQGVPIEGALTATLLLRGCTTWLPLLPGVLLARRELRAGRAQGRVPAGA